MEITGDLCGVFDKIDAQRKNESHMHNCYITMWSICCHSDKSLAPVSRSVIGDWSHTTKNYYVACACRQGDGPITMSPEMFKTQGGGGEIP